MPKKSIIHLKIKTSINATLPSINTLLTNMKIGDRVVYVGNDLGFPKNPDLLGRIGTLVEMHDNDPVLTGHVVWSGKTERCFIYLRNIRPDKDHYLKLFKKLYERS